MKMILINAIYFKGEWEKQFKISKTSKREFMNYKKEKTLIDFMFIKDKYDCFEDDKMKSVSLNYKNDNIKALIILPNDEYDINKYIQNFTMDDYNNILKNLTREEITLYLPKFEINFECELKNVFKKLGMKKAFTNDADFFHL